MPAPARAPANPLLPRARSTTRIGHTSTTAMPPPPPSAFVPVSIFGHEMTKSGVGRIPPDGQTLCRSWKVESIMSLHCLLASPVISVCTAESPHSEGKYSLRKTDATAEAFCLSNYEIYLFQEDHAGGGGSPAVKAGRWIRIVTSSPSVRPSVRCTFAQ